MDKSDKTRDIVLTIYKISLPTFLCYFFLYGIDSVSLFFIGREGTSTMMASIGITNTILSIIVFCPILGLNLSQATLVSQSYGKRDLIKCGHYLNKVKLIGFIYCSIVCVFLLYVGRIMTNLGMNAELS